MRHNPRVMFGLSALVMGLSVVLSTALLLAGVSQAVDAFDPASETLTSDQALDLVSVGIVPFALPLVVQWLAMSVLNGVLISAVSDAVIGRRPTAGDVLRRVGWSGVLRLLLVTVATAGLSLLAIVVIAVPVAVLFVVAVPAGVVAAVLGTLLAVAVLVFLYVRLAFAAPALLLERLGVVAALRRSWRLGTGSWWRVLGVLLLTAIIAGVTSGLLQLPFGIIGELVGVAMGSSGDGSSLTLAVVVSAIVSNLGAVLAATVVSPFSAAVVSLLYIDLRIRREGLDVALVRAAAATAAQAGTNPASTNPPGFDR
jgi:hypothetical protein